MKILVEVPEGWDKDNCEICNDGPGPCHSVICPLGNAKEAVEVNGKIFFGNGYAEMAGTKLKNDNGEPVRLYAVKEDK
jgi:hypothetical protein